MKLHIRFRTERLAKQWRGKVLPYPPPQGVFISTPMQGEHVSHMVRSLDGAEWGRVQSATIAVPDELGPLNSFEIEVQS